MRTGFSSRLSVLLCHCLHVSQPRLSLCDPPPTIPIYDPCKLFSLLVLFTRFEYIKGQPPFILLLVYFLSITTTTTDARGRVSKRLTISSVVFTFAKLALRNPLGSIGRLKPITLLVPLSYSLLPTIAVASSHMHTVRGKLLEIKNCFKPLGYNECAFGY